MVSFIFDAVGCWKINMHVICLASSSVTPTHMSPPWAILHSIINRLKIWARALVIIRRVAVVQVPVAFVQFTLRVKSCNVQLRLSMPPNKGEPERSVQMNNQCTYCGYDVFLINKTLSNVNFMLERSFSDGVNWSQKDLLSRQRVPFHLYGHL